MIYNPIYSGMGDDGDQFNAGGAPPPQPPPAAQAQPQASDWANNYVSQQPISSAWGNANDLTGAVKNFTDSGMSDADAQSAALQYLGWGQQRTTTGGPGGPGGGGGQTNTGGIFNPNYYTGFSGGNVPGSFSSYLGKYPMPQLPQWQGPAIPQAPAFSYADFKAPTLDEAKNQPGYQFGVDQGLKALQQSRAAQGLLRTGGTLKDIQQYGQNAATQNYGNVLQQDAGIYDRNRANAVGIYNTNYQTQYMDPYKAQFADAQAKYAPQLLQYQTQAADAERQAEFGYNADWAKYLNQQDVFYNNQSQPFQKYLSLANIGAGNA